MQLKARGERYLFAVSSNTLVRDIKAAPPEYSGRGRHPMTSFMRVDHWRGLQPESAWTTIEERLDVNNPIVLSRRCTRWLERNEPARFYHHHIFLRLKNQASSLQALHALFLVRFRMAPAGSREGRPLSRSGFGRGGRARDRV